MRVTADALRQIRAGHPWVFESSIASVSPAGASGDLGVVFDERRRFRAIGLYDPSSPLRLRILHRGRPLAIDDAFWQERVASALDRRAPLLADGSTTGWRWIHGENDLLPGLVVDRYADTTVIKAYTTAWIAHLGPIRAALRRALPARRTVLRWARTAKDVPGELADPAVLDGDPPDAPVEYLEHGLRFAADVLHGQKTGAFLDQRDNRSRVGRLAGGAHVLDVFCATGGFGVFAAAGGARTVHSVDVSPAALETAAANMKRNAGVAGVAGCAHTAERGDAFSVMRALGESGRRFGLIVVDPPSMASRATQVASARRAYTDLADLASRLLVPGGVLVQASCTARIDLDGLLDSVRAGSARAGVALQVEQTTGHPIDHPIGFPQGGYLKAVFARRV